MSTRGFALAAAVSSLIAAAMTLLPWVSLEERGLPMRWAGLGFYYGDDIGSVPAIQPLGWVVVVVALEALTLLGFQLFVPGGTPLAGAARWLFAGLAGLATVAAVLMAVAIAVPSLLYGNLFAELAAYAGADVINEGRDVVAVPTLIGVAFWLVVTAVVAGLGFVRSSRS
ncbi:hypothetical protein GOARA_048_00650 [Gordonia araii NBRC 100433]|uniref:Uncharacterized protein n=1 Tax=Gordonia araii NBRC 100433 TaxID=1073574 RepID=G7H1Y8_9ACTN|nr:hypothetical protein [Gordonia araii]NNG97196.1 hypothetical protein [Gordonia araii NBRC 100433]GAB09863.1 hypothetical protein GOARA_048_00650 [Gordonia araii NBRC 100433]